MRLIQMGTTNYSTAISSFFSHFLLLRYIYFFTISSLFPFPSFLLCCLLFFFILLSLLFIPFSLLPSLPSSQSLSFLIQCPTSISSYFVVFCSSSFHSLCFLLYLLLNLYPFLSNALLPFLPTLLSFVLLHSILSASFFTFFSILILLIQCPTSISSYFVVFCSSSFYCLCFLHYLLLIPYPFSSNALLLFLPTLLSFVLLHSIVSASFITFFLFLILSHPMPYFYFFLLCCLLFFFILLSLLPSLPSSYSLSFLIQCPTSISSYFVVFCSSSFYCLCFLLYLLLNPYPFSSNAILPFLPTEPYYLTIRVFPFNVILPSLRTPFNFLTLRPPLHFLCSSSSFPSFLPSFSSFLLSPLSFFRVLP